MRKKIKAPRSGKEERSGVRAGLTLEEYFDLTFGQRGEFATEGEREANYWAHRDRIMRTARHLRRPRAFWDYEPDVPADCRPDAYDELLDAYDPALQADVHDVIGDWCEHALSIWAHGELERRRSAWLLGAGQHHLKPGEREAYEESQELRNRKQGVSARRV
jgi:FAD/FMN-containing dehydrogenase